MANQSFVVFLFDIVVPEPVAKSSKGSLDRDVALAKLEDDKRYSFIKAWEESEKTKVENKAHKQLSDISAWENSKKGFRKQVKENLATNEILEDVSAF
ncbi:hypothetical protein CASFOL_000053 [Castilleja foliolosa]|uniref:Remorin C-terminal domain-containing protein n=1 Tax=Castilleja foliolosa TaxID=1961234 RepID=A0ABD3EPL9_9LAMI